MNTITEYYIATADRQEDLLKIVNNMLSKDWQPFGGVSIIADTKKDQILGKIEGIIYSQALVKYQKS